MTGGATRLFVGVDVGGTKTMAALVRLALDVTGGGSIAEIVDHHSGPSSADSPDASKVIRDGAAAMLDAAGLESAGGDVEGIGVGLAGYLDLDGIIRSSPNAPGLIGLDLRSSLFDAFGIPVLTENDANCVAVAANHLIAPASGDLVAVTLGTGIGGGIIMDGRLVRGHHGFAGEPGHMVIDPNGPRCPCGQRGCWERYASGSGLRYLARRAAEAGNANAVLARAGSLDGIRGEDVTTLVEEGDRGAEAIFAEFIRYVALGVANLINIVDPEVIVLGGGLVAAGDRLLNGVRTELRANYPTTTARRGVRIEAGPNGSDAGAVGAAIAAARFVDGQVVGKDDGHLAEHGGDRVRPER